MLRLQDQNYGLGDSGGGSLAPYVGETWKSLSACHVSLGTMHDDMHAKADSNQVQVAGEPCRLHALPLSHHHLNGMLDLPVAPLV